MSKLMTIIALSSAGVLMVTAPPAATASTPFTSYSSPKCPTDVATWRIAYRLYWSSTSGQVTSDSALPAVLEEMQRFAEDITADSDCGVRAVIDVYDEGAAQWPTSAESSQLPPDSNSLQSSGHYDWIFYRFPSNNESYCANASAGGGPAEGTPPSVSRFPVDPEGHLGCASGPDSADCQCEPWRTLIEHEWLHAVVAFYNPRLGWPVPDVHGACEHGYSPTPCPSGMTNESYFSDMMRGRVAEGSLLRGIQHDEWTLQGTPAEPLIHHPAISVERRGDDRFAVQFPHDLGGPVQMAITDSSEKVVRTAEVTVPGSEFFLPTTDSWNVCLAFAGSETYYRRNVCTWWSVPNGMGQPVSHGIARSVSNRRPCSMRPPRRRRHRWPLRISRHAHHRYRLVAPRIPVSCRAVLIIAHHKRRRRIRGRHRGNRVIFRLRTRGSRRGRWKVMLRIRLDGGGFVTSRHYTLRARRSRRGTSNRGRRSHADDIDLAPAWSMSDGPASGPSITSNLVG